MSAADDAQLSPRQRRLSWVLLGLQIAILLGVAVRTDCANPPRQVSGATTPDGVRFGLSETQRRRLFEALLRGEPQDRLEGQRATEAATWNRNHDDYFHEREWRRISSVAAQHSLPVWQAFLIFDEGLRAHWPPPPGVEVRADDAPLKRTTTPFNTRPVLLAAPSPPPPPPATP